MFESILSMIKSGQSLAKSLKAYNHIFSDVYVNMIATGEESGTLEDILEYLDLQLEKEYDLRKKVKSAFIYPVVILSITMIMALGIVIFIMPKVTRIFTSFDMDLPLLTKMLIVFSNFLTGQWYFALAGLAVVVIFLKFIFKIKIVRRKFHVLTLYIPIFGKILKKTNLARFARTLNSLLQSGVPMTRSLEIVGDMINNDSYKKLVLEARDRIEQGGSLGESFSHSPKLFPPLVVKMLSVGDKSGNVESATQHLAELYEKDVDNITKNLSTLLEPLLLVLMGLVIGGLALSIIMPIYQLPSIIQR